jgi:hypothetical protein
MWREKQGRGASHSEQPSDFNSIHYLHFNNVLMSGRRQAETLVQVQNETVNLATRDDTSSLDIALPGPIGIKVL